MIKFVSVALAFLSMACESTTEPRPIPIQFKSASGVDPVPNLTISSPSARIQVVGGFQGSGCGVIGAFAEATGSVLRLTVGPRVEHDVCDAVLMSYGYSALLDVPDGTYSVQVFHRRDPWVSPVLAGSVVVTVR